VAHRTRIAGNSCGLVRMGAWVGMTRVQEVQGSNSSRINGGDRKGIIELLLSSDR